MRTCFFFLSLLFFFSAHSCGPSSVTDADHPMAGTWKMLAPPAIKGRPAIPMINSQVKIFTRERFFLINYIEDGGRFGMAVGGPFTAAQDSFVETIGYYSEDPSFVGTVIPFVFTATKTTYHQSGVIKSDDEDQADLPIEESYQRLEPALATVRGKHPLIGVWKLEKAAYDQMTVAQPLPEGEETYKVITPGYFYTVQSNPNNGKFSSVVFGSHAMDGDQYTETILTTSRDSLIAGWQLSFEISSEENSFSQSTVIKQEPYRGFKIEEHFQRVE